MPRDADRRLARIATSCHGIFSTGHAQLVGLPPGQRKHRIETGQWLTLHDRVYRIAGAPPSWKGALLAACWAGGFRAVASHRSAAALWKLAGGRRDMQEITCPRWLRARHDGLVVHETKALDPIDTSLVDGIPVTTAERTLLDLGAVCGWRTVEMALDKAEHRGLLTRGSVEMMLQRLACRGRRGVRSLRRVLEHPAAGCAPPASEMETRLVQILRENGIPVGIPQYEIRIRGQLVARVDLGYPEQRVAVEYDSDEWHGSRLDHERDSSRRRRLQAIDWETATATRADLRRGGPEICAALRALLASPRSRRR